MFSAKLRTVDDMERINQPTTRTEPAAEGYLRWIRNWLVVLIVVVILAWLDLSQAISRGTSFFWGG